MRWRLPRGPLRIGIHSLLATILLMAAAIWRFDLPVRDMVQWLLACLLVLVGIVGLAALCGWLLQKARKRTSRNE